jgi:hypothetical protein
MKMALRFLPGHLGAILVREGKTVEYAQMRRLRDDLEHCLWLAAQLELAITRQTVSSGPSEGIGKSVETPLYFNSHASEAKHRLAVTLGRIQDQVLPCYCEPPWGICFRGRTIYCDNIIIDRAKYLLDHYTKLDNAELVEQLSVDVAMAYQAVDSPPPNIYLGDCYCKRVLYGNPEAEELVCDTCQHIHNPASLRFKNQQRGREMLVSATDAAKYVGAVWGIQLKRDTIYKWGKRGKLNRWPTTTVDTLWRLGEIVDLAMAIGKSRPDKSVR